MGRCIGTRGMAVRSVPTMSNNPFTDCWLPEPDKLIFANLKSVPREEGMPSSRVTAMLSELEERIDSYSCGIFIVKLIGPK